MRLFENVLLHAAQLGIRFCMGRLQFSSLMFYFSKLVDHFSLLVCANYLWFQSMARSSPKATSTTSPTWSPASTKPPSLRSELSKPSRFRTWPKTSLSCFTFRRFGELANSRSVLSAKRPRSCRCPTTESSDSRSRRTSSASRSWWAASCSYIVETLIIFLLLPKIAHLFLRTRVLPHTHTDGVARIFPLTPMPWQGIKLTSVLYHLIEGP